MNLIFFKDEEIKIEKLRDRKKYPVDINYQREPGAWTRDDEQYFIDSLLKKIKVPKIYLHKKRNKFYIVDGQQRIETIRFFVDGRKENGKTKHLRLNSTITGRKKDDMGFENLKRPEQERFLNYGITASIIKEGNDDQIRELFRRLQRGKPLTEGERLNAMKGNIVKLMRNLTEHEFFKHSLLSSDKRHKFYHIAAVFLYIEDRMEDTTFKNIEKFFQKNESMQRNEKIFRNCWKNLNFLSKCYKENELPSSHLGWLTTVYLFIKQIRGYGLLGKCSYEDIHDFLESFYVVIYDEAKRKGEYKKFYDMIRSSTNKKSNILGRNEILEKNFKNKFTVHLKDEKRLWSSKKDRKIVWNKANGKCEYKKCKENEKNIKFNRKFEIHHKKMYASAGGKKYENAMLVHPACHHGIHRNMPLKRIPSVRS